MDLRAGSGPSPPGRRRLALDIDRPGTAGTGASEAERGVLILYASPCPMLPIFASFMPIYRLKVWGFVGSPHEDGVESGRCRPHHLEKVPASVRSSGSGQPGPGGSGHGDASRWKTHCCSFGAPGAPTLGRRTNCSQTLPRSQGSGAQPHRHLGRRRKQRRSSAAAAWSPREAREAGQGCVVVVYFIKFFLSTRFDGHDLSCPGRGAVRAQARGRLRPDLRSSPHSSVARTCPSS